MSLDRRPHSSLPLKQYVLTLQSAQAVLSSLLVQPVKPIMGFQPLIQSLGEQVAALRRRGAAYQIQCAFRRHRSNKYCVAMEAPRGSAQLPVATTPRLSPVQEPSATASLPQRPLAERPTPPAVAAKPPVARVAGEPPAGTALNPIERRRLLVASQLAASNPSRLARSRKLSNHRSQKATTTPATMPAATSTLVPSSGTSASSSKTEGLLPPRPGSQQQQHVGGCSSSSSRAPSADRVLLLPRDDEGAHPEAALTTPRCMALQGAPSTALRSPRRLSTPTTEECRRGGDVMLKDNYIDDDPLSSCMAGPDLRCMAPPPPPPRPGLRAEQQRRPASSSSRGGSPSPALAAGSQSEARHHRPLRSH